MTEHNDHIDPTFDAGKAENSTLSEFYAIEGVDCPVVHDDIRFSDKLRWEVTGANIKHISAPLENKLQSRRRIVVFPDPEIIKNRGLPKPPTKKI